MTMVSSLPPFHCPRAPHREPVRIARLHHLGHERLKVRLRHRTPARDGEAAEQPVGHEGVLRARGEEQRQGHGGGAHRGGL
jgi:hypothetical protein